jgi:apolipoprotein N-acyltransferase
MRALESRRYLLRAANDGVSAVIAPDGGVVARATEFAPQVLRGQFTPRQGATPYLATGNLPVLALAMALLVLPLGRALRFRFRGTIQSRERR